MPYQSDWRKIETFEAVFAALARPSRHPRILCGDFNTPIHESQDGKIYTGIWRWQGRELTLRPGREGVGGRWDRAELSILRGLSEFDLSDVFRKLYGPERVEFSFYTRKPHAPANASDPKFGRRFDHVLASTSLSSPSFEYLHRYRTGGLSDHSPCAVLFDLE
jgi:exonuclease III